MEVLNTDTWILFDFFRFLNSFIYQISHIDFDVFNVPAILYISPQVHFCSVSEDHCILRDARVTRTAPYSPYAIILPVAI